MGWGRQRWARLAAALAITALLLPGGAYAGTNEQEEAKIPYDWAALGYDYDPLAGQALEFVQEARSANPRGVCLPADGGTSAPLYETAAADSPVLMHYYRGAPLQVIRRMPGEMLQVQLGGEDAGVTGFMRAADAALGVQAQREAAPVYMELHFGAETPVYAAPDTLSAQIGRCRTDAVYYAMGRSAEGWVQLCLPPVEHVWETEDRLTAGFVKLETGLARAYERELEDWVVEPVPGEITEETAIRLARIYMKEWALGLGSAEAEWSDALWEALPVRAYMRCWRFGVSSGWVVYFWELEGGVVIRVTIAVDGEGAVGADLSYIEPEDQPHYSTAFWL